MKPTLAIAAFTLAFGAGAVVWNAASRAEPAPGRPVTGIVVAAPEGRSVRVAHDEIAGYMPAMTMAFTLANGESAQLGPGDRIRFVLRVGNGSSLAEDVTVIGRGPIAAAAAPAIAPVVRVKRGDPIPDVLLVDQDGAPIVAADFRGHLTVMTFVFTRCPMPEFCPLVTSRFKQLQTTIAGDRSLPADVRLLSVSLDPAFDTPAVLLAHARGVGANPDRWRFAGGDPDDVLKWARAFSVFVEQKGALLDHTLATALIDRRGHVVEIWRGNGWKVREVIDALRDASR